MANFRFFSDDGRLPDQVIGEITREAALALEHRGISANFPKIPPVAGQKGDAVTIGQLTVDLITSGAVTALIGVLKELFSRHPDLSVEIDGKEKFIIRTHDISPEKVQALTEKLNQSRR